MKRLVKNTISEIVKFNLVYNIFKKTLIPISNVIAEERYKFEFERTLDANPEILNIFKDLKVLNGPFKGLKYPNLEAFGSSLLPKLLGSYEIELNPVFENILKEKYFSILDVGCAEGYYAIGLARMFPTANIYAFDTSEKALSLCKEMGEINNIGERLIFGSFFSEESLIKFDFSNKSLLICDCEGFEKHLFTNKSIKNLRTCDVLIETHDIYDNSISYHLEDLFKETHDLTRILSIDDLQKVKTYNYKEIDHLTLRERKMILEEQRSGVMEWHFYKAKRSQNNID